MSETARRVGFAALLLGASQLVSRALGVVREMVLAAEVGAGAATDAYQAAFQLPDLLNHLLASAAIATAFIPLYRRAREQEGAAGGERLFANIWGTLSLAAVVLTAGLFVAADSLVALLFPEFGPDQHALTVRLTRIVLPAQVFFASGGIVRALLMAEGRFGAQAAAPVIYNLGIITGGLVGGQALGVEGFAWGALIGAGAGHLLLPLIDARRHFPLGLRFAPLHPDFRRYVIVVLPLLAGVTLLTVDEWFDRYFGQFLGAGAIASLFYARRLMQAPVGLIGQAAGTAALPTFAGLHEQGRHEELHALVLRTLQATLSLGVLVAMPLGVLAAPLVDTLYVRGAFSAEDGVVVAGLLQIFAFAIPGWVVQSIAVRPFYARGDTWRPMLLGTGVAVLAIPLYAGLGPRFGPPGLAAAGALAITANALATLLLARRLHAGPALGPLGASALRAVAIAAPAGLAGWWAVQAIAASLPGGLLGALGRLFAGGAGYTLVALPLALRFGDEATRAALSAVLRRLAARRPGPPA